MNLKNNVRGKSYCISLERACFNDWTLACFTDVIDRLISMCFRSRELNVEIIISNIGVCQFGLCG